MNSINLNNNILKRNLIIYDHEDTHLIEKFIKKYNLLNWLRSYDEIWKIYYGKVYNPPHFGNIIVLKKNLTLEALQHVWNMVDFNGSIIIDSKYETFYINSKIKKIKNDKKIIIKKNSYRTYYFKKYRIIDFIIAGTKKGGTTAGIVNLSKHPDISMYHKEIHYYSILKNFQKGEKWYMSHFNYKKKRVGDKAPDIMYQDGCLQLLQETNPHVKIIIFLRNPIERAYSDWKMTRDKFNNKDSFEYCIMDEYKYRMNEPKLFNVSFYHAFLRRGFYYKQIQNILKYFCKDNLLVLISENIRETKDKEYQKVFDFLELEQYHDYFVDEFVSSKPEDVLNKNDKIYSFLKNIYTKDVENLEKFLGYKTGWW